MQSWGSVPHHALPSQEVRDDFFIHVVHQSPWTLVVISSKYEELLARVLINQWTDLHPDDIRQHNGLSGLPPPPSIEQPPVSFWSPLELVNPSAGSLHHLEFSITLKCHIHIAE